MDNHKCEFCNKKFKGKKERKFCSISCSTKRQYRDNPNYGLQKRHKLRNGLTPWNKGKPNPDLSKRQRGNNIAKRPEVRAKMSKSRLGVRPWNWKGGHSKNRKYQQKEWFDLIKKTYKRDNYTCQICNKHGGQLNAHHIIEWSENPEEAFNIDNLITLCVPCHSKIHYKKSIICKTQEGEEKWLIKR